MRRSNFIWGVTAFALLTGFSGATLANEEKQAKKLCKQQMRDKYEISKFRDTWVEQIGNHKFKVHGKAIVDNHGYPFDCKVKHGHIKSYAYNGPNPHHANSKDEDDDSNLGTVLAVGAGIAILAALASNSDDDKGSNSSNLKVKKSVLEDDCHDMLQYRIRDEHDGSARVVMKSSAVKGHDLKGEAKVKYNNSHPHHATYTCHFNKNGRLLDSSYHLY